MADGHEPKEPKTPDWQLDESSTPAQTELSSSAESTSRESLLERAKRFLEDDAVRDAPRERKIAFLQKKGLQGDDIQKLLGPLPGKDETANMKTIHDSMTNPPPSPSPSQSNSHSPASPSAATPSRDVPPIITYPEFLLKRQKPPPLITFQRLLYAAYGFAGISAVSYEASKYLVQPMLQSLAEARHELAEAAVVNLEYLNSKLEANVSHVPYMSSCALPKHKASAHNGVCDDGTDVETIDSDPSELFHRDIATQTSPKQSRAGSLSSSTSFNLHRDGATNHMATQSTRLSTIHTCLSSFLFSLSSQTDSDTSHPFPSSTASLQSALSDLESYLETLQYNSHSAIDYASIYAGYESGEVARRPNTKTKKAGAPEEEAEKFKAEIKAIKGALLSSKTFPRGGSASITKLVSR